MLRNINVVASLMPNDKLNTEGGTFAVYVPTATRGAWRYWASETREANLTRVQSAVRQAKTFISGVADEQQAEAEDSKVRTRVQASIRSRQCIRMLDALKKASGGLENLCQTYRDDASIVAKINMVRDEIDDFVGVVCREHGAPRRLASLEHANYVDGA